MQPTEIFRLLTRQMPKRVIVFQFCSLAFMACSFSALVSWRSISWAVASFLASFLLILAWVLLRQKCIVAWKVSNNPELVYWAHSHDLPLRIARFGMNDYKVFKLHLRDGEQIEVNLPPDDLQTITAWLSERNSSVRWGAYDLVALQSISDDDV